MAKPSNRFVAKAEKGAGWRIWDNMQHQFWGPVFPRQPSAVLSELNASKRGSELEKLVAAAKARVDQRLLESIKSGPVRRMDRNAWNRIRSDGAALARQRKEN